MKKIIFIITLFSSALSLTAQNWGSNKIRGNGNVVTVERTTDSFDKIVVGGSFDVVIINGKQGKISIEGEENIIPYLETEVDGDVLKIGYKRNTNISTSRRFTVTVSVKEIEALSLGGSGNITSKEMLKSDNFSVNLGGSGNIEVNVQSKNISSRIGGSGDIKLKGSANDFSGSIAGSGSIKAYEFKANKANITIAGSGNIRLTVKDEIQAKVVGSGNIYYKGNPPRINTRSMGSGKVIDKN